MNGATILVLVGVILREVWQVMQARRRGRPPPGFMYRSSVCSQSWQCCRPCWWRSSRTSRSNAASTGCSPARRAQVIENSLIVARAYMRDHAAIIRADILGMANDFASNPVFEQDRQAWAVSDLQAASRELRARSCSTRSQSSKAPRPAPWPLPRRLRRAGKNRRNRTANRGVCRIRTTWRRRQVAYSTIRIFTWRAGSIPRRRSIQADQGERRRICRDRSAAARRSGEFRVDLRRHRADHPDGLDPIGTEFRQSAGDADPAADGRRQMVSTGDLHVQVPFTARKATSRNSAKPSTR